jgi:5-methylcytosine-specific restriction endonuclease McrA
MNYEEQLKDERWKYKRQRIIDRDFGICQVCMSGKNLNVHHKYYIEGRMAWDYPDYALITLCSQCHKAEHESKGIDVRDHDDVYEKSGAVIRSAVSGILGLMAKERQRNG